MEFASGYFAWILFMRMHRHHMQGTQNVQSRWLNLFMILCIFDQWQRAISVSTRGSSAAEKRHGVAIRSNSRCTYGAALSAPRVRFVSVRGVVQKTGRLGKAASAGRASARCPGKQECECSTDGPRIRDLGACRVPKFSKEHGGLRRPLGDSGAPAGKTGRVDVS